MNYSLWEPIQETGREPIIEGIKKNRMELGVLVVPTVELSPPPGRDEHSLQQVVQHGQHSAPACQVQAVPPVALLKGLLCQWIMGLI